MTDDSIQVSHWMFWNVDWRSNWVRLPIGRRQPVRQSAAAASVARLCVESLESRELLTVDPRDIIISGDLGQTNWAIVDTVSLPHFQYVQGPSGVTAPGQAFDPSSAGITFGSTPAGAAPDISEWTRTARPDESISVTGDDFSSYLGGVTQFYVFSDSGAGPGKITLAATQTVEGDNRATFTLPSAELPNNAMYLIWAADDDGYSRPVAVNQTETWWIGPNAAQAGQTIAVYGRNLSQTGGEWISGSSPGSAPAWVWVTPASGGTAVQAAVKSVNPYRVEFVVPGSLAAGTYKAWVHNGRGGAYGWGAPLEFVVRSAQANGTSWTGPIFTTTNTTQLPQMLSNAAGADDGVLLQAVLNAAAQTAYSTVVLPAGVFWIASPLRLPSNVRLLGQGMNQTVLKAIPGPAFFDRGLFYGNNPPWSSNNVLMQSLTLHSGYNPLAPTDALYSGGITLLVRYFNQVDVKFKSVRFEARSGKAVELTGTQRVTLENCEFFSHRPVFIDIAKQVFVAKTTFYLTNLAGYSIYTFGGEQLSITESTARSENIGETHRKAKWGARLYVNGQGGKHQYIAHNTTTQIGLPPGNNDNVGEQILWEGATPGYLGSPTGTTTTTLTFALPAGGVNFSSGRHYVTIVQGSGLGQSRRIVSQSSTATHFTLTLESPLAVQADSTSMIQVLLLAEKNVVYRNNLNGIAENMARSAHNGTAGIMLFGGTSNIVIDNNSLTNLRLPISVYALANTVGSLPVYEPSLFNVVSNNTINQSRYGIVVFAAHSFPPQTDAMKREMSTLTGTVVRGNQVLNGMSSGFDVVFIRETPIRPTSQIVDNLIVEHNRFTGVPVGMNFALATRTDYRGFVTGGATIRDALVYKNVLQHKSNAGAAPDAGSKGIIVGEGQSLTMSGNTIVGFQTPYADAAAVVVRPTGVANQYSFTLSGRDVDRKSTQFDYRVDWNGDGIWDPIASGATTVTAGGVYTVVHTFGSSSPVSPRFQISPVTDPFFYEWTIDLDFTKPDPKVSQSPISAMVVAGPTATSLQFAFTFLASSHFAGSKTFAFSVDWNGDGDYSDVNEVRVGVGSASWTRTFASSAPQTLRYRVVDAAGNAFESAFTIQPSQRVVTVIGSEREDWVTLRETSTGNVTVDLKRLGGQEIARSFSFQSVASVMALGNGGPDWIDASELTSRAATIWGGTGSDSLIGGAGNDVIYGGGPAGTMWMSDAPNAISGGGGSNTIVPGSATDVVSGSALAAGLEVAGEQGKSFRNSGSPIDVATEAMFPGFLDFDQIVALEPTVGQLDWLATGRASTSGERLGGNSAIAPVANLSDESESYATEARASGGEDASDGSCLSEYDTDDWCDEIDAAYASTVEELLFSAVAEGIEESEEEFE